MSVCTSNGKTNFVRILTVFALASLYSFQKSSNEEVKRLLSNTATMTTTMSSTMTTSTSGTMTSTLSSTMPTMTGTMSGMMSGMMPPPNGMMMGPPAVTGNKCGLQAGSASFTYTEVTDDENGTKTGFPGGYRQIQANGCPGYDWSSQTTPNTPLEQNKTIKLPLSPKISTTRTYIGIKDVDGSSVSSPPMGAVGIAINGVAIYGNADAEKRDAYVYESKSFDTCGGHPQQAGEYHYHAEPGQNCVFKDVAGQHSPIFGFMYDGIPIYGVLGDNGVAPTDLDVCGGHVDKTNPFYHYHLPNGKKFPYTLTCILGCVYTGVTSDRLFQLTTTTPQTCKLADKQYDFSALTKSGAIPKLIQTIQNTEIAQSYQAMMGMKSSNFLSLGLSLLLIILALSI